MRSFHGELNYSYCPELLDHEANAYRNSRTIFTDLFKNSLKLIQF